jgi:hypothetical protein
MDRRRGSYAKIIVGKDMWSGKVIELNGWGEFACALR